jgi:hypothetical protein
MNAIENDTKIFVKHHRNRNDYYYAGENIWIRDFTKNHVIPVDVNNLITPNDTQLMLANETENSKKTLQRIDTESFTHHSMIIVNTGYLFKEKHALLDEIKDNVAIMGVNDALNMWMIKRRINYYIVNNPFSNCVNYLPQRQNWVRCIASKRTNYEFINRYKGLVYQYSPVNNQYYSGLHEPHDYEIDDYRNPICGALGLAFRFKVQKVLLFCCDEGSVTERPGMVSGDKGLWAYPQQVLAHKLIDGNLHWLAKAGVKIGHYPDVLTYANSKQVSEDEIATFFN